MSNTMTSLREEVRRAFEPLTEAHGFERSELHCDDTHETFFGDDILVRASRDRELYVDVAGISEPDCWFNVLRVIHALTGDDWRTVQTFDLADAVDLVGAYLDILHEGLSAKRLAATKELLNEERASPLATLAKMRGRD